MTDLAKLRERIDSAIASLEGEFPAEPLSRALLVKSCEISLASLGPLPTVWMTEGATNLLAGHWSPSGIEMFIETRKGN